jgi:hypothetical protein
MNNLKEELEALRRLERAPLSYNYCLICGYQPAELTDQCNYGPIRYWDPDDGWRIGTLCFGCARDVLRDRPKPGDYAYRAHRDDVCSTVDPETDDDPMLAL